ncbi:hypothetical protein CUR178_05598 [Leishmania enriettii]|uniref:Trypanosoma Tc-38 (p38) protein domain-containing protein n=1 Tax=Leishmania enriettii TaxID=5663 RepID=A0A836GYF3_LEIEN|nr:hypothetical protein CUR178_05598 [Leishmania enriettii]
MAHFLVPQPSERMLGGLSRTLCGHAFSAEHHHHLCAIARARGWAGRVWVPVPVMELLSLPLSRKTFMPVRLTSSNGSVWVYHSSQFIAPLDAMQERWNARLRCLEAEEKNRDATLMASRVAPDSLPLSTNGERFDSATEDCMLRSVGSRDSASRYWATEAEAAWLYRTPFTDTYVSNPGNCVVSHANELCRPLALYNVEGTVDPSRFTKLTCRRYDPVNYNGHFYRPAVAMRMKMFALQYDCLDESQWITPRRAARLGLSLIPHVKPLLFSLERPLFLISIGATQRTSAPASVALPALAAGSAVTRDDIDICESQREKSLLTESLL